MGESSAKHCVHTVDVTSQYMLNDIRLEAACHPKVHSLHISWRSFRLHLGLRSFFGVYPVEKKNCQLKAAPLCLGQWLPSVPVAAPYKMAWSISTIWMRNKTCCGRFRTAYIQQCLYVESPCFGRALAYSKRERQDLDHEIEKESQSVPATPAGPLALT